MKPIMSAQLLCWLLLPMLLSVHGCVTPMDPAEVEDVTTCRGTDLVTIRKNLLLDGFTVEKESASDLVTDFKQSAYWNGDRRFIRVTVVEIGEKTFKLKVRTRTIRIYQRDHVGMGVTNYPYNRPSGTVILDFSRPVEVEHEADMEYFKEDRDRHAEFKARICGEPASSQPVEK